MRRPSQLEKMESEFTKWIQFLSSFLNNVIKRGSYPHCKSNNFVLSYILQFFIGEKYARGVVTWHYGIYSSFRNIFYSCDQTRIKRRSVYGSHVTLSNLLKVSMTAKPLFAHLLFQKLMGVELCGILRKIDPQPTKVMKPVFRQLQCCR